MFNAYNMRVTVKGVLLGGSFGVLITTTLLWSQCRNPTTSIPEGSQGTPSDSLRGSKQQRLRQPHGASRQSGSPASSENEEYIESFMNVIPPPQQYDRPTSKSGPLLDKDSALHEGARPIPCLINLENTISCIRDENDVYIPFSFIQNYFEIYGRLAQSKEGNEVFEWSHSYSHVFEPHKTYSPWGPFLNFNQFNVEARERVKCVSAVDGIPISTQWDSSGYAYPIQIAQYGLSHFSKYIEEPAPNRVMLDDGYQHKARWKFDAKYSTVSRPYNKAIEASVLKFSAPESFQSKGILFKPTDLFPNSLLVLRVFLRLAPNINSSLTVALRSHDSTSDILYIHYICSNQLIEVQDQHIYYGIGSNQGSWRYFTRNLMVDALKGAALSLQPKRMRKRIMKSKFGLYSIELRGNGELTNLSIATSEHIRHFYDAADWFLKNQDEQGGWPIPVARKVIAGLLEVEPGWYSAMAQGQAISLLVRASHYSGKPHFLDAARRAIKLFSVNATEGGIRTYFPGSFIWYEEYPTSPSLFVLNGFMYSLLGLYDLKESGLAPDSSPAAVLFQEGMRSLKTLLPLFDSGHGSFYDLRHFTSHVPPNIARWDYHTTHITQLLTLATIDGGDSSTLYDMAQRWKGYLVGRRAKHN